MSEKDKFKKNLISFLTLFKNRPNHLAKYFIENNAFSDTFMKKIMDSQSLNDGADDSNIYFLNISDMNRYFSAILKKMGIDKSSEEITKEINERLDLLISEENYEEAILVREYMVQNNILRIK
jgi:hypothetical protein